jgi:hypothetical protein
MVGEERLTGGDHRTLTVLDVVLCNPESSLTVSVTAYDPAAEYECVMVAPVPVDPSPKSHA